MRTVAIGGAAGGLQAWGAVSGLHLAGAFSSTELCRAEPSWQSSDIRYEREGQARVSAQ